MSSKTVLTMVVAPMATLWVLVVGALAWWRHDEFLSHRFDLGNMVQAVWSTAQGRPLELTDSVTGEQIVRLGAHVDPILVLLAPLWWVYPSPHALILAQVVALAAGVYPVVRLGLKYTESVIAAALLAAWYLAFPWVVWNAINDVHPVTFAIPLLLYAIWFLDEQRLGLFTVFAALALLTGELVGLTVAALGIWYAVRYRRATGLAIASGGVLWTAVCLAIVVPAFNEGEESRFYGRFETVGGSPQRFLETLFTDPGVILGAITTGADLRYLALLLIPTAFLALGQPLILIAVVPQLGLNVMSDFWSTTQPMFQYVAPVIAPLVAATVMTVGRFPTRLRVGSRVRRSLLRSSSWSRSLPSPGGQDFVFGPTETGARTTAMRTALKLVPSGEAVMTTNRIGAHLSARETIQLFPVQRRAEWAVLDTRDSMAAGRRRARGRRAVRTAASDIRERPFVGTALRRAGRAGLSESAVTTQVARQGEPERHSSGPERRVSVRGLAAAVSPALRMLVLAIGLVFAADLARRGLGEDWLGFDLRGTLWDPAIAIREGRDPYPAAERAEVDVGNPALYPPLLMLLVLPLTFLPWWLGLSTWLVILSGGMALSLYLLGVRDVRCYVAALVSAPVVTGLLWANAAVLLVLPVALAWKWRSHQLRSGVRSVSPWR